MGDPPMPAPATGESPVSVTRMNTKASSESPPPLTFCQTSVCLPADSSISVAFDQRYAPKPPVFGRFSKASHAPSSSRSAVLPLTPTCFHGDMSVA